MTPEPDHDRRLRLLAGLAVVAGVAARVAFLGSKPFWRDEAWVAVLLGQPLSALVGDPHRPVPIGFVVLAKLSDALRWLAPELRLRLVPLACGCAALPALAVLARRLGASRPIAVASLWLAAGLPGLIYYSRELKPYSVDLLLAIVAPLLATRLANEEDDALGVGRGREWWVFIAVLVAAPWVSFGAVFVVAATLSWVCLARWRRGTGPWNRVLWPLLAAGASTAAAYAFAVRSQSENATLLQEWGDELAPVASSAPQAALVGLGRYFQASLGYIFPDAGVFLLPLLAAGAVAWPRRHRSFLLWLVAATAAATVSVSLLGRYPVGRGRLLLFAAPPYVLLAASGLVWIGERVAGATRRPFGSLVAVTGTAAICLFWSGRSVLHRVARYQNDVSRYFLYDILHDVEPLIGRLDQLAAPGDAVMTSRYSGDQFRFYARGRLPQATVCRRTNCRDEGPPLRAWFATVGRQGWMILLAEEDRPWRRRMVRQAGFDLQDAATARGALLWRLTRQEP
jgi:hypothetical protein